MQRRSLYILILAAVLVAVDAASLCERLAAGSGSQRAFMQQLLGLSFTSITNDNTIAPFFDGTALDRGGHNVTNYIGNNTLFQQLIESHVRYFGKLFNCTDSSIPNYDGPSMESAHANLKIDSLSFERYQLLTMTTLPIAALGKATTSVEIEISEQFEKHRGIVAEDRICNEDDCKSATLTLDDWDNLYPMFLNMEQQQTLTITNADTRTTNFTLLNISDGECSSEGPMITVAAGKSVTTTALGDLPAGDYYFGVWPSTCMLDVSAVSPMISKIRVHSSAVAPVEAPVEPPVESPVESPVEPPVESPVESPIEPPVEPPVKAPVQPPTTPVSPPVKPPPSTPTNPPVDTPLGSPVNAPSSVPVGGVPSSEPSAQPVAAPESHEDGKSDLMPVVIILSIAVAILLAVVIFLVYKLKKKEPHYEIIND